MSARIVIRVYGTPVGQPRPRAFARKMKSGQVVARLYDAGTAEAWKTQIAAAAMPHRPAAPIEGPVCVDIDFLFARPKYLQHRGLPDGEMTHVAKPDVDNAMKAVLDALTVLGFWRDDAQVCDGRLRKRYVARDALPGARIVIEPITPTDLFHRSIA